MVSRPEGALTLIIQPEAGWNQCYICYQLENRISEHSKTSSVVWSSFTTAALLWIHVNPWYKVDSPFVSGVFCFFPLVYIISTEIERQKQSQKRVTRRLFRNSVCSMYKLIFYLKSDYCLILWGRAKKTDHHKKLRQDTWAEHLRWISISNDPYKAFIRIMKDLWISLLSQDWRHLFLKLHMPTCLYWLYSCQQYKLKK